MTEPETLLLREAVEHYRRALHALRVAAVSGVISAGALGFLLGSLLGGAR